MYNPFVENYKWVILFYMKKILLGLILLISSAHALCNNVDNPIPTLTPADRLYLKALYELADRVPSFEKEGNLDFDYYLDVLEKHIKIIENKIRTKKNGWSSKRLKIGLAVTTITGAGLACLIYPVYQELSTGIFNNANVPYSMIEKLSSLTFTRAEKKKLDLVDVKKITIVCEEFSEQYSWRSKINALSPSAQKNLDYLASKNAISLAKGRIWAASATLLGIIATLLCPQIYKAIYYTEHLTNRLERDRRLYKILLKEKNNRQLAAINSLHDNRERAQRLASVEV